MEQRGGKFNSPWVAAAATQHFRLDGADAPPHHEGLERDKLEGVSIALDMAGVEMPADDKRGRVGKA